MHHFKYRKEKIKLLREIEIVIINEVSMVRADVLDMMDFALRKVRRNQQKFGGVQMLFIGDLYQLRPVVRDEHILKQYYPSPFFFESYALKVLPALRSVLTSESQHAILPFHPFNKNFHKILNLLDDPLSDIISFLEFGLNFEKLQCLT